MTHGFWIGAAISYVVVAAFLFYALCKHGVSNLREQGKKTEDIHDQLAEVWVGLLIVCVLWLPLAVAMVVAWTAIDSDDE